LLRNTVEKAMTKISFETRGRLSVLTIAVYMVLVTCCSRQLYQETSIKNIESSSDKKKLKDFMDAGIEKGININNTSADEIINTAQKYMGVPHCMGGTTMKCMDCSGLLVTVFAKHGIRLPHNSEEQARYGKIITGADKLIKGDLVFFIRSYKTYHFITHSGIYIGNNKFIHTSSTNGVTITSINDPWWNEKFIFATRVF
jgi:lipoprotein Spr